MPTTSPKVVKAVLQYQIDQAGVTQILAANQKIASSFKNTDDVLGSIGRFSTSTAVKQVDALTTSVNNLKNAFQGASSSAAFADPNAGRAGGLLGALEGAQATGLGRVGSQLRTLPSVQIPGVGIGTDAVANLLRAGGALEALGVSAGVLATAVGVGIPVVLAIVAAINLYNGAIEAYSVKIKAFAEALNEAFGAGTTQAIEALKAEAQLRHDNAAATYNDLAAKANAAPTQFEQTSNNAYVTAYNAAAAVTGAAQMAYDTRPTLESYTGALAEQKKIFDDSQGQIDAYNAALDHSRTAEQDRAKLIDDLSKAQLDAAQFATTATTDSVKKRLDAYQQEIQFLTAESSVLAAQGTDAANSLKAEIDARIVLLGLQKDATEAIKAEVAAREAEISALDLQTRMSKLASDFVTTNAKDLGKSQLAVQQEESRHSAELQKIAEDKNRKIEEIENEAIERAGELAEKYGIERQRAQEDLQRELRKLAASEGAAIGERDALGLKRLKNQEREEKEQARVKATREQQDYERELRDLAKATQKKIDVENAGARRSVEIETAKYNAEISARQQALNIALEQYRQFVANLKNIPGSASINGNAVNVVYNPNGASSTDREAARRQFEAYQRSQGVPGFASGLKSVPYDNYLARLHKGEGVLTAAENRRWQLFSDPQQALGAASRAALSVNILFNGKTYEAKSRLQAIRVVRELMDLTR